MKHMTEQEIRTTDFNTLVRAQAATRRRGNSTLKEIAIDLCADLCNAYTGTFKLDNRKGGSL